MCRPPPVGPIRGVLDHPVRRTDEKGRIHSSSWLAADGKMLVTERVARVMRSDREDETAEANR